jgi:hypothetical protein
VIGAIKTVTKQALLQEFAIDTDDYKAIDLGVPLLFPSSI